MGSFGKEVFSMKSISRDRELEILEILEIQESPRVWKAEESPTILWRFLRI